MRAVKGSQVAPHAQRVGQRRADHRGGKGLKGDRPCVVHRRQRLEAKSTASEHGKLQLAMCQDRIRMPPEPGMQDRKDVSL